MFLIFFKKITVSRNLMRLFYEIVSRLLLVEQQIALSGARERELKPERVGPDTEGGDESQCDHIHASNSISMGCSPSELEAKEQAGGAESRDALVVQS